MKETEIPQAFVANHTGFRVFGIVQFATSKIANTLESTSIRYRSDIFASDRYPNDIDPRTFAIWDLFYKHGLTSIPEWISNPIHYEMWDEITYPFLKFNEATVEVGNG